MKAVLHGVLLACLLASGGVAAQTVVTTAKQGVATEAVGAQHRETVNEAFRLVQSGDVRQALANVRAVLAYCDQQLSREDIRFVSVANDAQYREYVDAHPHPEGKPTEWLDIACANAYTLMGFVHAGEKRMDDAMPFLDRAIEIAPFHPDPRTEKGFVLNQMGRHDEAIAIYREVIGLGERHPDTASHKGMALRGIGWALVEKGDLDAARQAYEASLVAEPGNGLALRELEYISRQRESAAGPGSAE